MWLLVPTEPVVICVQEPIHMSEVDRHETTTVVRHSTEAGHNPAARRPKRLRSDTQNCANEQYSAAKFKRPLHEIDSDHSRNQQAQDYE